MSPADRSHRRRALHHLTAAFLGWMFSGFQMAVMTLAARSATTEFLRSGQVSPSEIAATSIDCCAPARAMQRRR